MRLLTFDTIAKALSLCVCCFVSQASGAENIYSLSQADSAACCLQADTIACCIQVDTSDSLAQDNTSDSIATLSRYDKNALRYRKHWDLLIPTTGIIQTCGNMGLFSLGIGWEYGKRRQWETQLMVGFVPRFDADNATITFTLKENFTPWRKPIGKGWWFEPLECSLYFNTIFGHDFWVKQPTKYDSGYYPFSTRIRPNIALGERFRFDIPHNKRKRIKSVTFFYELSTNDIYFMRFYRNGNAGFWDVFGLSFGAKLQYL